MKNQGWLKVVGGALLAAGACLLFLGGSGCMSPKQIVDRMESLAYAEEVYLKRYPGKPIRTKEGLLTKDFHAFMADPVNQYHISRAMKEGRRAAAARQAKEAALAAARGGKRPCFVAGTAVHTPEGLRPIETIAVGDAVLSFDEQDGSVRAGRVTNLVRGERDDLVVIEGPGGDIVCSRDHSYYTSKNTWEKAMDMRKRTKLLSLKGEREVGARRMTVRVRDLDEAVPVYNLGVEGFENYFAGPDGILCHNTTGGHKH